MKLKLYLHIFQLEGYDISRFLRWVWTHPSPGKLEDKKPLVWTAKARLLYLFSWILFPITFIFPWLSLVLGMGILWPFEYLKRQQIKIQVKSKIEKLKNKGLVVVGITGSYGKTSTKEFLYQILKTKYRVLRTPESFNTMLGIAKVVNLELDESYGIFICEMGAYKRGEIAELCQMVKPDYGILTGINEQHLERFGSLENIRKAKFELVNYVGERNSVINGVNYGLGKYNHPSEQNMEGAVQMARILGVKTIPKNIKSPEHRLILTQRGEMTIIDDAFSSNVNGFKSAIKYLTTFPGWKVVVTPGITELGKKTESIHKELGTLLQGIDQVILVGKNDRTRGLEIGYKKPVEYINQVGEAIGKVKKSKAVVLFENDLPDNY